MPIEPPTCCAVFSVAEVTPASCGATPAVAVANTGMKVRPKPRPSRISAGSTSVAYEPPTEIFVIQAMPPAAISMPGTSSIRGGSLVSSRAAIATETKISVALIGRNAKPVRSAE